MIDFLLHFDKHLLQFIGDYGLWVYGILFGIIFSETGFVVTPFLPGDSLLFATGAVAAQGKLNPWATFALLATAAFTGNVVNYAVGRGIGSLVFVAADDARGIALFMNREHLERTHAFFEHYGAKAIVLGRFVPVVRTFVPFVAGAACMTWATFITFNAIGAVAWVGICLLAGVVFGNVTIVRNNFSLVTIGIVVVSVIPIAIEYFKQRGERVRARSRRQG